MNKGAKEGHIDEFRSDRELLDYPDTHIAARMGIDKGNYSKYINGRQRITRYFLTKFYQAFGDELSAIKLATGKRSPTIEERLDEVARRVDQIQKECDRLTEKFYKNSLICALKIFPKSKNRRYPRVKTRRHISRHNVSFRKGRMDM